MPGAVSLARLVGALQFAEPGAVPYVDVMSGEVLEGVPQPISSADADRYRPVGVNVDELELARRFCQTVTDAHDRRRLETSLASGQPMESFENSLYRSGIAHEWFPFRERETGRLVKDWLTAEGIAFVDDLG
jgi:Uncharacterised protein family (UPF0158)